MRTVNALAMIAALAPVATPQDTPRVELEPRTIAAGAETFEADAGKLVVPESRGGSGTRTIELAVVILRSTSDDPGPPLVFLAGGPGNPAVPLARSPTWARFLELGDVVLLDQRGVGESRPRLLWESDEIHPELLFGTRERAFAHMVEIAGKAAEYFRDRGVDLAAYNTVESADDVEDLRLALGYDRIRLMGHSYGTHLGLAFLRRHGEHVERFVSVGTAGTGDIQKLPSESDASLHRLAALVAADARWKERFPDLFESVKGLTEALAEDPLPVAVHDPRTGREVVVSLGPFGLQLVLLADLGDTSDLPVFPRLIDSLEERDASIVRWFVQKRYDGFTVLPVLTFVNRGASGATAERWARIEREAAVSPFWRTRTLFSPEIDRALGTVDLGDDFRAPVTSDVPTLFVSGTLDANTPPEQAERVRAGFAHASHVVVENAGHEDLLTNPEVQRRILAFLAGEEPADERIPGPPLVFVPPEGDDPHVGHPSIPKSQR